MPIERSERKRTFMVYGGLLRHAPYGAWLRTEGKLPFEKNICLSPVLFYRENRFSYYLPINTDHICLNILNIRENHMMNLSPQTVAHIPTTKMKRPAIYNGMPSHKTNQSAKMPPITIPKKNRRIKTIKSVFSSII